MAHRVSRQRRRRGSQHDGETTAARVAAPAEDVAAPVAFMRPNAGHDFARMAQTARGVSRKQDEAASEAVQRSIDGTMVMREGASPPPGVSAAPPNADPQATMLRAIFHGNVVQPLDNAHAMMVSPKPNLDGAQGQFAIAAQTLDSMIAGARASGNETQALRASALKNIVVGENLLLAAHQGNIMPVSEIAQRGNPAEGAVSAHIVAINDGFEAPQTVPTTGGA